MKHLRKKNCIKNFPSLLFECSYNLTKVLYIHEIFSFDVTLKVRFNNIVHAWQPWAKHQVTCVTKIQGYPSILFPSISWSFAFSSVLLGVKPCCTTAPQSGSWATCSRISSTSRFFPGGSTSFVIFCCRVRGSAISWINWPSGLLSTYRNTSRENVDKHYLSHFLLLFSLIILNDDLTCITLHLI